MTKSSKKVSVKTNALSMRLIHQIRDYSHTQRTHRLNLTSWTPQVVGVSGPIMLFDLPESQQTAIKQELKRFTSIDAEDQAYEWAIVYTLGSRLSYVPWHSDEKHFLACTVYLNEVWDKNWGGSFVYEEDRDDIRAVYPAFNTALMFYPPLMHATNMPTLDAPIRESIQIFIDKKDQHANA